MTGFDIWNELGNTYFKAGAFGEAIEAYEKAIELNPGFGWAYSNLALAFTCKGKLAEAIPLYQKSIELLSDKADRAISWNRLGDAYRQLNEYDNAAAAYETADRLSPNRAGAAQNNPAPVEKAVPVNPGAENAGRTRAASSSLPSTHGAGGLPEVDLKNAHIWNELGNIFVKAGAYEDAIDAYEKAIRLDAAFAWPYSNLAMAYTCKGKYAEAIPLYKKSIELFTTNKEKAVSWDRLGDVYRRLKVYKDAIAAYEIAKKLTQENDVPKSDLREVNIEQICLRPRDTRIRAGVDELAESIRTHGIIQPLIVCRNIDQPDKFWLIAGKRRLEAARQVGLESVPVIVRQVGEREMLELALNENIHRADSNPMELAEVYRQLAEDFGMGEDEISRSVGKTRYTIANTLRLLELPDDVKLALTCKRITEIHARFLFNLSTPEMRSTALQYILRNELSIQQTEDLIRKMSSVRSVGNPSAQAARQEFVQENAAAASQKADDYRPESIPLMTRARFILMSNPRVEHKSQPVSS